MNHKRGVFERSARFAIATLVAGSVACGSTPSMPTQGAVNPLVGLWNGSITDSVAGSGTLTLDLRARFPNLPSSTSVIGSWHAGLSAGNEYQDAVEGLMLSGVQGATNQGYVVATCSFAPPVFNAIPILTLSLNVADRKMTGTYQSGGCSGFGGGTIDLTRQ